MRLPRLFVLSAVLPACAPTLLSPEGADPEAGLHVSVPTVDCAMVATDVEMRWSSCGSQDCYWSGGEPYLRTPTTGAVVKEAHLVTVEDGISGWPTWSGDRLADHYAMSEALTGYHDVTRTEDWAPAGEGGSRWGQGSTGAKVPADAEAWYITMNWADRPAPGTPMIVRNPATGEVVVAAAGYETGPGSNTAVAGVAEEIHHWLGTDHLDDLEIGFAADTTLPFGPVACEGEAPTEEPPPASSGPEACFVGADRSGSTCLGVEPVATTGDYDYPSPLSGSPQYSEPDRFLALADHDPATMVAPNFELSELAQEWKGSHAVVQTHAVAHLQDIRDELGPLVVNSGYRSPDYNDGVGGATWSRHMYGDAFDLSPSWASLSELRDSCYANGAGYVGVYSNHVHCDWRDDALDGAFYDGFRSAPRTAELPRLAATIERVDDVLFAPAAGWDEGEPLRQWTAWDGDGDVILEATGTSLVLPPEAVAVRVVVGLELERTWTR